MPHTVAVRFTLRIVSSGSTPRLSAENAISSPTAPIKNWLRGSCMTTPILSVRSRAVKRYTSVPQSATTPVNLPGKNVPARPLIILSTVDFPLPDRPQSTMHLPGATASDTSSTRLSDASADPFANDASASAVSDSST